MRHVWTSAALLALAGALLARPAAADPAPPLERTRADLDRAVGALPASEPEGGWASLRRHGPPRRRGWSVEVEGALLHQFPTDVDDGGRFEVDRLFLRANVSYSPKPGLPLTLTLGYRYDGYRFSRGGAFGDGPWDDVHSPRATLPIVFPLNDRWLLIGGATVRSTVESGAPIEDGVTWGGFAGALYRVNDRLFLGPGLGLLSEIEDDASWFPILLIHWKIVHTLSLQTGQGLGATQGPGLFLEWLPRPGWEVLFGGRFDRLRFRMDDRGVAPGGVGQETATALLFGARHDFGPGGSLSASVGMNFFGQLRLEDARGTLIQAQDYDLVLFVAVGFSFRL